MERAREREKREREGEAEGKGKGVRKEKIRTRGRVRGREKEKERITGMSEAFTHSMRIACRIPSQHLQQKIEARFSLRSTFIQERKFITVSS